MGAPGVLESDNYGVAYRLAAEKLRTMDPAAVAERSRAEWTPSEGVLRLGFLGTEYRVGLPDVSVTVGGPGPAAPAPIWESILILHYLGSEGPVPARGEPIAFAEVPSGAFYDPAFRRRSGLPLVRAFGGCPGRLGEAAAALGGRPWDRGDVSAVIPAFPRVDVHVVLYRGDDEFPADGAVLFSSDVAAFLSTEDVAVLGGMVAGRLVARLRDRDG